MPSQNEARNEIIQIYFDCICGTVCSITALIGIFVFVLPSVSSGNIKSFNNFVFAIIIWFGYLFISLFIIGLGIFTHYKAKNYSPDAPVRKKLKAPMIS